MGALDTPANRLIAALVGATIVAGLLFYVLRTWRRRRARRRLVASISAMGFEALQDVLVPDGMGGGFHVDFLLLTARGVLVIDLRDVRGNIFGGDQMTEWTVMNGPQRSTFPNPQHALYDRVAAVRQLSGDLPVEGRILFTKRGRFPKGLPRWTLMVDSLRTEFPLPEASSFEQWLERYRAAWDGLAAATQHSPLRRERPFFAEVFLD